MKIFTLLSIMLFLFVSVDASAGGKNGKKAKKQRVVYKSENLKIIRISKNAYVHISSLEIENKGIVECNGLIYRNEKEVVVFDSPTNDLASADLLKWCKKKLKTLPKAVIVNHFHNDCVGGLKEFHKQNIPSYGTKLTNRLAEKYSDVVPQNGFGSSMNFELGSIVIRNEYFGEAHTRDNIISYIPGDNIMYGGCMIREDGGGKGNLLDANRSQWANTLMRVQEAFPDVQFVVPGHGKVGGPELIEYTIQLFTR